LRLCLAVQVKPRVDGLASPRKALAVTPRQRFGHARPLLWRPLLHGSAKKSCCSRRPRLDWCRRGRSRDPALARPHRARDFVPDAALVRLELSAPLRSGHSRYQRHGLAWRRSLLAGRSSVLAVSFLAVSLAVSALSLPASFFASTAASFGLVNGN